MYEKITVGDIKSLEWLVNEDTTYTKKGKILIYIVVNEDDADFYSVSIHYLTTSQYQKFSTLNDMFKWIADKVNFLCEEIRVSRFKQNLMLSTLRGELNIKLEEVIEVK